MSMTIRAVPKAMAGGRKEEMKGKTWCWQFHKIGELTGCWEVRERDGAYYLTGQSLSSWPTILTSLDQLSLPGHLHQVWRRRYRIESQVQWWNEVWKNWKCQWQRRKIKGGEMNFKKKKKTNRRREWNTEQISISYLLHARLNLENNGSYLSNVR